MGVLIKNEFYKLKREWFMVFLLLLSLLPIITGGAGAIFNSSTTSLADLFFFMNNQFSMFFPMVLFILIGSLFYQEYKNKTYINWITYGFSKKKLFLSKVTVSVVIGICFAAVLFIAFGLLVAILNGAGRLTGGISLFLKLAIGFGIEAGVVVFVTTCLGAIVINLSRNIIVTSVVGVIYGFVSCLFIGSENGKRKKAVVQQTYPRAHFEPAAFEKIKAAGSFCLSKRFIVRMAATRRMPPCA